MLIRNCAGGVIFNGEEVFLLKNEKGEWTLPKGVIRGNDLPSNVALERTKQDTGLEVDIVSNAGRTSYEFFSQSKQRPVCNKVTWYIMQAKDKKYNLSDTKDLIDGGFFKIDEALDKITYSQDKSIVNISYKMLKQELDNIV